MDDATTEDAKIRTNSGGGGRSKEGEEEEDGKSENRRILDSEIRGKGNYNGDGEAEAMGNKVTYSQALVLKKPVSVTCKIVSNLLSFSCRRQLDPLGGTSTG